MIIPTVHEQLVQRRIERNKPKEVTAVPLYRLGIDVVTRDATKLILRLNKLKTTIRTDNGGMYREDNSYTQIHVLTTKTEEELDDWLYRVKHDCEYVGTFTVTTTN